MLPQAARNARIAARHWDVSAPAREIDNILAGLAESEEARTRLRRSAVARLALEHFHVQDKLPPSILSLFPDHIRQLAEFLAEGVENSYNEDYFIKDVRYALGLTVPAGAQQFDLYGEIGPKLVLREITATKSARAAVNYLKARGWGRWYNEHTDLRRLQDFNPEGWTAYFARMAEVLALNPSVRGLIGGSWFFDPALAEISPNIAYIGQTQVKHGGFLLCLGTAAHDIENAIAKSTTRRRLYEEGKYVPTSYLCAWPRDALERWACRLKTDASVAFARPDAGNRNPAGFGGGEAAASRSSERFGGGRGIAFGRRIVVGVGARLTRNWPQHAVRSRQSVPFVSFTFDDFPRSAAVEGLRVLANVGAKGTYFVSGARMGQHVEGLDHFTEADIQAVVEGGHELGCHTFSHSRLPTLTRQEIEDELVRNRELILRFSGCAPTSFAYPFGAINLITKALLARRFPVCRGIDWGVNQGFMDFGQLKASIVTGATSRASLSRLLDKAQKNNGWLIFFTHDVSDQPSLYGCRPSQLEALAREVASRGIKILPVRDVAEKIFAAAAVKPSPQIPPQQQPAA